MNKRRIVTGAVLLVLIVAVLVYFFVDPSGNKWMPRCLLLSVTGYKCPGCGSQRMIHALLHGDLQQALHYNAFLVAALPVIVLYLINDYTKWCPQWLDVALKHTVTIVAMVVLVFAWWIMRNIYNW